MRTRPGRGQKRLRALVAPLVAYCLVIQGLLGAIWQASTLTQPPLASELCLIEKGPGAPADETPSPRHHHAGECCLPGQRDLIDIALPVDGGPVPVMAVLDVGERIAVERPRSRAPPSTTATPRQPRAPPLPA